MSLSGKEKFSYGLGAVGKDMVYMLSASYILYYYQDILGVNAILHHKGRWRTCGNGLLKSWHSLEDCKNNSGCSAIYLEFDSDNSE